VAGVAVVAGVLRGASAWEIALAVVLGEAAVFAAVALSMRVLRRLRQRESRAITVVEEDGRWMIVR
jgi:hypothetical protein